MQQQIAKPKKILGTQFLADKAQQWGHWRFLAFMSVVFGLLPLAVLVLLAAALPYLGYGFSAPTNYQPDVFIMRAFIGAPGETSASGLRHLTTLITEYSDHLTLVEIPAGDAKRTSTLETSFEQHGSHPRIVSMTLVNRGRAHPDLVVRVSMDWQSLFGETYLFDFSNKPENTSDQPGKPGYGAPQFGLVTVTAGG